MPASMPPSSNPSSSSSSSPISPPPLSRSQPIRSTSRSTGGSSCYWKAWGWTAAAWPSCLPTDSATRSPTAKCGMASHRYPRETSPSCFPGTPRPSAAVKCSDSTGFPTISRRTPMPTGATSPASGIRSQLTVPFRYRRTGHRGHWRRHVPAGGAAGRPASSARSDLIGEVFANALARKHAATEQIFAARAAGPHCPGERHGRGGRLHRPRGEPAALRHREQRARAPEPCSPGRNQTWRRSARRSTTSSRTPTARARSSARVRAFLQRKPTEHLPLDLNAVVETVRTFLGAGAGTTSGDARGGCWAAPSPPCWATPFSCSKSW